MLLQIAIAIDQLINALLGGGADETLSARCYRAHRDGKIMGKVFMRPIDLLFFWQGPNHCRNAYIKEFERKHYPSEYHGGVPIFESRAKGSR